MKKIALLAAGAAAVGGGTAVATTATAASSTDAVRAVQTASKGVSHKAYELDRERNHWEVTFADGTQRHVTLDGRRVTATERDDDRSTPRRLRARQPRHRAAHRRPARATAR